MNRQDKLLAVGTVAAAAEACLVDDSTVLGQRQAILAGVAAIVAEATKPKTKSTSSSKGGSKDFRIGAELREMLVKAAPNAVLYDPPQPNTYARLGRALRQAEVTEQHKQALADWLEAGGLSWMDRTPTWGYFVTKVIDWIAQASSGAYKQAEPSVLEKLRRERGEL